MTRQPAHAGEHPPPGFWRHLGVGLLVTVVLIVAKVGFEHTAPGHRVELWTYEALHDQLPLLDKAAELPVVVVDISTMPGGKPDTPTPRDGLKELLGAIAATKPAAIAVDVDFAPDGKGWITDDDPEFFDDCLTLTEQTGVPIYLGVFRTAAEPSDAWLGSPKYSDLAAALLARGEGVERLPRWIQTEGGKRLPTLSWALASAHGPARTSPHGCNPWLFECSEDGQPGADRHLGERFVVSDFLVNYSKLEELRREMLHTSSVQSVNNFAQRFKGRMVILGDAVQFTDSFIVPGQKQPVAGVYILASGAYTLVQQPLWEFNWGFRLFLDGILSLLFIVGVFLTRGHHHDAEGQRSRSWFLFLTVCGVLVAGVLFIRLSDVMWLDFLLVGFAVALHPKAEGWLASLWRGLTGRVRKSPPPMGE